MKPVSVSEARKQFSRLLARVESGEEVVILRRGKPVARLVAVSTRPRRPGRLKGKIWIAPAFDDPLPEEIAAPFRGEGD